MLQRAFKRILFLLLLIAVQFSSAQENLLFQVDSTTMRMNIDKLKDDKKTIISKDSVIRLIQKGVNEVSPAIDDLSNYFVADYFLSKKLYSPALSIINKQLEDDYEVNHSDAKFYYLKGRAHADGKEFDKAIQSFLAAASRFQQQNHSLKEAIVFSEIANIYLSIEDFEQSYNYSKKSFDEFRLHPDRPEHLRCLGVLIISENNIDLLDSAKVHLNYGMSFLPVTSDEKSKVLLNYANSEWLFKSGEYHKAQPYAFKSMRLSDNYNLQQYKVKSAILLMNIHNKLNEYRLALDYGFAANSYSDEFNSLTLKHVIANGISEAYAKLGDFKKAYEFMYQQDSLKSLDMDTRNKRSMDSLLVQFQSLASENKILSQEAIIANQNHLLQRRRNYIILGGFALSLLMIFIVGFTLFNRQQMNLISNQQEAELAKAINDSEEAERNRLASELHDGLAAELTALKLEMEQNSSTTDRAFLMLSKAHQMTRSISHNLSSNFIHEIGFIEALANLISSYNIRKNITFYTNITERMELASRKEIILYRSVQELLQNAIKHAKADGIAVQAILNDQVLSLSVEDDGVGINADKIQNSIGLNSLKRRIELINGNFDLESFPNRGTSVFIKIKLES